MRSIDFPAAAAATGPRVSVLGFGCAGLLGRASRRESITALSTAFDAGITFYDTARSYGYGAAEGVLGQFLADAGSSRRDEVILCTKFGILPAARNWKQVVKPVARAAIRLVPSLRQAAQRQAANQFTSGQFSLSNLQFSLDTSLRQLRTTFVDMLLLHAAPASVLAQDDLLAAMQRLVEQGKVRLAGISGEPDVIAQTFRERPTPLSSAQFAVNLSNLAFTEQTAQNADLFLVANHPFGGPAEVAFTRDRITALATSPDVSAELRSKLTPNDPQLLPEVVFNTILSGTGIAAVIPAMIQPKHIQANIRAVEECRFSAAELSEIRAALSRTPQLSNLPL